MTSAKSMSLDFDGVTASDLFEVRFYAKSMHGVTDQIHASASLMCFFTDSGYSAVQSSRTTDCSLDMSVLESAGGVIGLRARATIEVIASLRSARRMTSLPTKPDAPVTINFMISEVSTETNAGK